jgi:hypothetical protein
MPRRAQTGGTGDKVRQKPSKEVDRGVGHPATRSRATAARNSRGRRDEGGEGATYQRGRFEAWSW